MARVKKDKKSYRAEGIWKRDFVLPPEETKHQSKKDTKKWCKGKVGREHDSVCVRDAGNFAGPSYTLLCKVCKKKLDWWWNSRWAKPKPDWIVYR